MNFLKERLFSSKNFENWETHFKLIRLNSYRLDVNQLLNDLKFKICPSQTIDSMSTRRFISAHTMIKFNMLNKNETKDLELYYKSIELIKSFDDIFENNEDIYIHKFFDNLSDYLETFEKWKEIDEKALADSHLTQQYKEIQVMEGKFNGDNPGDKQLRKSATSIKKVYEKQILQIGGEKTLKYINESPKLQPMDIIHIDMGQAMKKAYWDMFEEDINNNNLEGIGKNLDEFRKYMFKLLGNSEKAQEIKNQFDNQMDIDLVKQMIANNVFDSEGIFNIIKTLIHYVKQYIHSASEDKDTEIFLDNVYKKFSEENVQVGSVLRYFFQNIFIKLDNTNTKLELLNFKKN